MFKACLYTFLNYLLPCSSTPLTASNEGFGYIIEGNGKGYGYNIWHLNMLVKASVHIQILPQHSGTRNITFFSIFLKPNSTCSQSPSCEGDKNVHLRRGISSHPIQWPDRESNYHCYPPPHIIKVGRAQSPERLSGVAGPTHIFFHSV